MENKSRHIYSIIIGCGRLGSGLAGKLSEEGKDVMVIDSDKTSFRKLPASYGGLTMVANATDIDKLNQAEIHKADTVIAVTDNDNANICAAQIAKKMFGVERVIARIYDDEKNILLTPYEIDSICPAALSEKEVAAFMTDGRKGHET